MKYENEYKYYLRSYIDINSAKVNGSPTKEEAIASALAEYDNHDSDAPRSHQEFEDEMIRMRG